MVKEKEYLERAASKEYENYDEKGLELRARPFLIEKLPKNPRRLLVVGMALGGKEEIESLKKFFPAYKRYGIDIAKSALSKDIDALLFQSDVAKLYFKDRFFSGIMCSAVMHEVYSYSSNGHKNVDKAFSEISRTLIKGGLVAIREFYVPNEQLAKVELLTKKSRDFTKNFLEKFRKKHDARLVKRFSKKGKSVYSTQRLLYELLLHFRVANECSPSMRSFFKSKEIEEQYLPLSLTDYFLYALEHGLEVVRIEYIDFKKYYKPIENNFRMYDCDGNVLKNKFGFVDILCRKK